MNLNWRAIRSFLRLKVRTTKEYRADLMLLMVDAAFSQLFELLFLWLVLTQFANLVGWTFYEVAFMWSLRLMSHGIYVLIFSPVTLTTSEVRNGTLDRLLIRPMNPLLQLLLANQEFLGLVDIGIGIVLFLVSFPNITVQPGVAIFLYLGAIIPAGALGEASIWIAVSALAFLITDTGALQWALGELWQFTQYPLHIYNRVVQFVLSFLLPFALFTYYPAALILGKLPEGSVAIWLSYVVPLAAPVYFALSWSLWHLGLRRYQSTGS